MAEKPTRHGAAGAPTGATPPVSPNPYRVILTATSQAAYEAMYALSVSESASAATKNAHAEFRLIEDAVQRLIPANPADKRYALGEPLAGAFRMQRGHTRICWISNQRGRLVVILSIVKAPKSEADVKDADEILSRLVKAGFYKNDIEEWQRLVEPSPDATIQ